MPVGVDAFETRIRAAEDVNLEQLLQWTDQRELGALVTASDTLEIDVVADRLWGALEPQFLKVERERLTRLLDLVPLWEHLLSDGTPSEWERYGRLLVCVRLEMYVRLSRQLG